MAISRPLLLALLGIALLGATALGVQNARNQSADEVTPVVPQADDSAPPPSAGLSPQETVSAAFSGGSLESGSFELVLSFEQVGGDEQAARLDASGAFESAEGDELPRFELDLKAALGGQRLDVGAVSLGDRGYVRSGERSYRVPDSLWSDLREARAEIASYAGQGGGKAAAGPLGLDTSGWLTDLKDEGEATLDGVETRHVSARVDAGRVARDLLPLASQGAAGVELPGNLAKVISEAVRRAEVDVYVGSDDRILRRLQVELELDFARAAAAASAQATGDPARARIELDFRLRGVNRPQRISAPEGASAELPSGAGGAIAASSLGLGALAIDPPPGLAEARAAGFDFGTVTNPAPATNNPRKVARALRANRKVVILFRNPRGLDDRATADAVGALRRRGGAAVFTDHVRNVGRFGSIVEDLGVSQAPAIVIIDRRGDARLIEGFVDAAVLAQQVADAR